MECTEDYGICLWRTFVVLRLFLLGNKSVIKASCEFSIDSSGDQSNLFFGLKHCGANLTCCPFACDTFNQIQFSKQNYRISLLLWSNEEEPRYQNQLNLSVHRILPSSWSPTTGFCLSASYSVWMSGAQTEFKRVAEENVTLPCHHHLGLTEPRSLDIEWLLHDSKADQKVVSLCSATMSIHQEEAMLP